MAEKLKNAFLVRGSTPKSTAKAYLYLFPALLILSVFSFYPAIRGIMMAFYTEYTVVGGFTPISTGFDNFVYVFNDPLFIRAIRNTFVFVIGVVPATVILSLLIAMLLNAKIKGASVYRAIYFLPNVTSIVAVAIVWNWIYHSQFGILNNFLGFFGIDPRPWLLHPDYAMTALIIMSIWRSLGFAIVVLLAGMQTINNDLYRAAKIDGANLWHRTMTVTIPMLSPTLFFVSIISVISSFRVFSEVFALFAQGGQAGLTAGPANSVMTAVFYIFMMFNQNWRFGVASAAATVLFVIIFIFTMIQMYVGKKLVHYK